MRALALLLCFAPMLAFAAGSTAQDTIEQFYRAYLPTLKGEPPMSKSFKALIAKNSMMCAKYNPNEVCGFGASGDPYLNAQEYEDGMTLQNTGAAIKESKPGYVTITLNVYPSEKDAKFYTRTINYHLIWENGAWVVDDMGWDKDHDSARSGMNFEIEAIRDEQAAKGNPI